ncbi:MAG: LysM peptidoglycan-binding domain-containing protein [Candidatus Brocadiaceae bacterium]|nr:LysM peptidoglycan-binding domain-containing protein [Candidatus Brocadiaceae bacterium]
MIESSINIREKVIADTADRLTKKFIESIPGKDIDAFCSVNTICIKTIDNTLTVYYRVQAGDTLSTMSRKFYGDLSQIEDIRQGNKDLLGDTLMVGQELVIPDIPILETIDEWKEIDKNKYKKFLYRVQWDDSLYEISSKVLQDGRKWKILYEANKQEIKDIQDLPVGQVLIIPFVVPE